MDPASGKAPAEPATRRRSAAERSPDASGSGRDTFEDEALPHLDALYGFALRLAGNRGRAEDFVQETMLQAWRSWHGYRPGTNCRAWLMTILRNIVINHHRAERKRAGDVGFEQVSERTVLDGVKELDPEGRFFDRLLDREVIGAIRGLPAIYREAVILGDLEGMPYAEIAEILDLPVGTVKSRLFRARKLLQDDLYEFAVDMGYLRPGRAGPEPRGAAARTAARGPSARRPLPCAGGCA